MAQVNIKTEDYNAVFLLRGLETFLLISGMSADSLEEQGVIDEELAEELAEKYEESVEGRDDEAEADLLALYKQVVDAINDSKEDE